MTTYSIKFKFALIILVGAILFTGQTLDAQVRLPELIGDGMVLQRNAKIHIWGWAEPGEKVKITFNNKRHTVTTGTNGKWFAELPAMKEGGPYLMDIDAGNHIVIRDILIGDVWFCSGQSNMVLPMERVKEKYPDEIANANYSQIRNFFVATQSDINKVHDHLLPGKWMTADPQNVLGFGAATYFFAKQLYNKYHVPIGIINSSVGGAPIQKIKYMKKGWPN
jgi:sialate O-acetylesterase